MNLILLLKNDFIKRSNIALLKGRRHKHMLDVHRIKAGDVLLCGIENGKTGEGKIIEVNNKSVQIEFKEKSLPPAPLSVDIVLALPRPVVFKRLIQTITAFGIKNIHVINTWRVEKSYWNSPVFDSNKIKENIVLGLEQAKDTIPPKITFHKLFKQFVKKELPNIIKGKNCYVSHPGGSLKISSRKISKPAVIAIGPEGGFIDREIESFEDVGFATVDMGKRIFKVETAVTIFLSRFL